MQKTNESGFSLVEVIVAMAVGMIVLGGAVSLFKQSMDSSWVMSQKAEMQEDARAGIDALSADLSMAGTGMPYGGITLPSGSGSSNALYGCSATACYINNGNGGTFVGGVLTPVVPGYNSGPTTVQNTDSVTLAYVDYTSSLNQFPLTSITPSGSQITVNSATSPSIGDQAVGIQTGDLIMLSNSNGAAVGVVTNVMPSSNKINFANSDPLNVNQPSAAFGNIAALGPGGTYPPTTATRILMVTYYIDTTTGTPRLMRQVNAHLPIPVTDNIENMKLTYDIYNTHTGVNSSGLGDAGGTPSLIKSIHIMLTARSPQMGRLLGNGVATENYMRINVNTILSPRNLSFHDTYQ